MLGIVLLVMGVLGILSGASFGISIACILIAVLYFYGAINKAKDDDIRHKSDYGKVNKCPKCGSTDVYIMTWDDKREDVAFWGGASSKIGKRYHCDNCNFEW